MFNMGVGGLTLPTPPPSTRGEICSCNSAIWGQGKLMSYNIWGDGQGRGGGLTHCGRAVDKSLAGLCDYSDIRLLENNKARNLLQG